MFRFYCHFSKTGDATSAITFKSDMMFSDRDKCQKMLDEILAVPGFTGGGLEQQVPGIGWVEDDDSAVAGAGQHFVDLKDDY